MVDFTKCPHCGSKEGSGLKIIKDLGDRHIWQAQCKCGIMTRLSDTKEGLQVIWKSRPNKKFVPTQISVKHPMSRGMEPGTVNEKQTKIDNSFKPAQLPDPF